MIKNILGLIILICILILIFFLLGSLIAKLISYIKKKLNYFPNKCIKINITNQKIINNDDLLDYYIIKYGTQELENHIDSINQWKQNEIDKCELNTKKIDRFLAKFDKNKYNAFTFLGFRIKTRYEQINYEKYPYKVKTITNSFSVSPDIIEKRIDFLKSHDYYVTYNNYHKVDQRKALTKTLRRLIKERDNYTCQICGKYMPDEIGLHIDHIIPIKKGGKSTPSNLRVLCSKCNGKKGCN